MKIFRLERSQFGSGSNKALIGNKYSIVEIPCAGCETFKEVRALFKPAPVFAKVVKIVFSSSFGDKEYIVGIAKYSDLPKFIAGRLKVHTIVKGSIHHDSEMCFESKVLSLSIISRFWTIRSKK